MNYIKIWCKLEHGRLNQLLSLVGITRQNYCESIKMGRKFKTSKINRFYDAMAIIDNNAATDICRVEKIINKCMFFSKHEDLEIRNFAQCELKRWASLLTEEYQ